MRNCFSFRFLRSLSHISINRLLKIVVLVVSAGTTGGVYLGLERPAQTQEITADLQQDFTDLEGRVGKAEKKISKHKDLAVEQQVQISDDGDYTRSMIRALAGKRQEAALDAIEEPPTVEAARRKADAIKRVKAAREEKLFDEDVDPFSDLD